MVFIALAPTPTPPHPHILGNIDIRRGFSGQGQLFWLPTLCAVYVPCCVLSPTATMAASPTAISNIGRRPQAVTLIPKFPRLISIGFLSSMHGSKPLAVSTGCGCCLPEVKRGQAPTGHCLRHLLEGYFATNYAGINVLKEIKHFMHADWP